MKIIKPILLFLSWLTLSPLLFILDGRWKLLPKWLRIVLFVFSPLIIITIYCIFLLMSFTSEMKQYNLCKKLYKEECLHEFENREFHRLYELSDEEFGATLITLKEDCYKPIRTDRFIYHYCWPFCNRLYCKDCYDNDSYIENWHKDLLIIKACRVKNARCSHCCQEQLIFVLFKSPCSFWWNADGVSPALYCPRCNRILYYQRFRYPFDPVF